MIEELADTCELVDALLDVSSTGLPPGIVERIVRQREAMRVLDRIAVPAAVFALDSAQPDLTNRAWRQAFVSPPPGFLVRVAEVRQTGADLEVLELPVRLAHRPAYYTAMLRARRGCLGAPTGVIVVCSDVTERVFARKLGATADTLIWSGDIAAPTDYWNAAWKHQIGEVANWRAAVHPDDMSRVNEAYAEAGRQRASTEVEIRLRRVRGDFHWHRVQFIVDTDAARWFGIAVDIHDAHTVAAERVELLTAARAARADAEQANRLKDEFLAAVSHELRAPLTTMLLWEKILREQNDPVARSQALDAIRQSALAQSRIVGDLLDVARAISGKLHIDLRPIAIGAVISEAIKSATPAAIEKRIALSCTDVGTATVEGDAARLHQVLDNLLSNAIKFTEPGGSVVLSTRRDAAMLVIAVTDSGRGIAADSVERIFAPFRQTEDVLTRSHGGLGLGLAISRQLVELHNGTLVASSPGSGCGSTMTVRLPLSHRQARTETMRPGDKLPAALERRRVLVVDDDARVRDALVFLLERAGATVDAADSAACGRQLLERHPDIVICDIAMPAEDGYSFIRTMRASGSQIPAIALTAHALEVDAMRANEAGFDLHLAKPVSFEKLVTSIGTLIDEAIT